ncbi:hypothetical protein QJS66_15340 [Kocuria rhizophila]|nr:hypothetical protein QJS66_15340 [Kocuria rhizophila]
MRSPMLELRDVSKLGTPGAEGHLAVPCGTVTTVVLGPSRSRESTLLRTMNLLEIPGPGA